MYQGLEKTLDDLQKITRNCRDDMHEPDEQGLSAAVVGTKLDNAFGEEIFSGKDHPEQEIVIILKREIPSIYSNSTRVITKEFNLCDLIALARKAERKSI